MTWYLTQQLGRPGVGVSELVAGETGNKIWDLVTNIWYRERMANLVAPETLVDLAFERLRRLLAKSEKIRDERGHLQDVKEMYRSIWEDPSKADMVRTWARLKGKKPEDGPPSGNDLVILSTAAKLSETRDTELLTFDSDFTVFSDEIKERFRVRVSNAGAIPS